MKSLIRITLVTLAMFSMTFTMNAQNAKQIEKAKDQTEKLTTALSLDDDTSKAVYDIYLEMGAKSKELWQKGKAKTITQEERKAQMKVVRKEANVAITALFDKDTKEKYRAYKKKLQMEKKEKK